MNSSHWKLFTATWKSWTSIFGSVCELDIIFNYEKAYFILDELLLAGEVQDSSKKSVLKQIEFADSYQEEEIISLALKDVGLI
jgi:AP-1 complex subunit sigma 1/2